MLVEPAVEADYDALCDVVAEVDRLHVENTPDVFRARTGPARSKEWLLERIRAADRTVLVARDNGVVVGMVDVFVKAPREGEGVVPRSVAVVDDVAVREAHRRRGIGRALLEAARDWAASKGAEAMQLHVWSWNAPARELYERLGYVTRGLVMELSLPA
jgi:ribosomal protein S18 acetylase RimI-like enzyme